MGTKCSPIHIIKALHIERPIAGRHNSRHNCKLQNFTVPLVAIWARNNVQKMVTNSRCCLWYQNWMTGKSCWKQDPHFPNKIISFTSRGPYGMFKNKNLLQMYCNFSISCWWPHSGSRVPASQTQFSIGILAIVLGAILIPHWNLHNYPVEQYL